MINRRVFLLSTASVALIGSTLGVSQLFAGDDTGAKWRAGKHYEVLRFPVRTKNPEKVEVVELFWYGCPHCYTLNPVVHKWAESQPEDVDFWLSPAMFGGSWNFHARAFYIADLLGVHDKTHNQLFDALVREHKKIEDKDSLRAFFVEQGVDAKEFDQAFDSFAVNSQLKQAESRTRSYRADAVPAMIVNGKYLVSSEKAGGRRQMFEVVEYLIDKERKAKSEG